MIHECTSKLKNRPSSGVHFRGSLKTCADIFLAAAVVQRPELLRKGLRDAFGFILWLVVLQSKQLLRACTVGPTRRCTKLDARVSASASAAIPCCANTAQAETKNVATAACMHAAADGRKRERERLLL